MGRVSRMRIVVMRMRRGRIVCLTLLVLAVAAGACIVKNRTWLGAVAAESVLSALLGGAEVDVAEVAVIDGRQLKLKASPSKLVTAADLREGRQGGHGGRGAHGGISVDTVAITSTWRTSSPEVDPLASVVRWTSTGSAPRGPTVCPGPEAGGCGSGGVGGLD